MELHKLTSPINLLQKKGHKIALVTDGRMSGASGSFPALIHAVSKNDNLYKGLFINILVKGASKYIKDI